MKLQSKVAVITGDNGGISFSIAQKFQQRGTKGAIVGRNQETFFYPAWQLGNAFIALTGDVTQIVDSERVLKAVANKFGKLDTLVVNAGGAVKEACLGSVASYGGRLSAVSS